MMDLFKDLAPSLLHNKNYIIDDDNEKEYNPYITNRVLSQHIDCLLYVNEINKMPNLDKKMQYDYFYHSLPAKKRPYQKWLKHTEPTNIQYIKEYYGFSLEKAKNALKILTEEQINTIKSILDKGGR